MHADLGRLSCSRAPVAQLDRARPSGGRGHWFESSRAHCRLGDRGGGAGGGLRGRRRPRSAVRRRADRLRRQQRVGAPAALAGRRPGDGRDGGVARRPRAMADPGGRGAACFLAPTGLAVAPTSMIAPGPHQFGGAVDDLLLLGGDQRPGRSRGDAEGLGPWPCGTCTRRWRRPRGSWPGCSTSSEDIERLRQQLPPRPGPRSQLSRAGERLVARAYLLVGTSAARSRSAAARPRRRAAPCGARCSASLGYAASQARPLSPAPLGRGQECDGLSKTAVPTKPSSAGRSRPTGGTPAQDLVPFTEAHSILYGGDLADVPAD